MLSKSLLLATLAVLLFCGFADAKVVELAKDNFKSVVEDENKNVFVLMYASWCGHCQRMKPEWQELSKAHPEDSDVVIAMIDADKERAIGRAYDLKGFPTIIFFPKNNKKGIKYQGARTKEEFEAFIQQHAQ